MTTETPIPVGNDTNYFRFRATLEGHYRELFRTDPEYRAIAARMTPFYLAAKMTTALLRGNANKDGVGIMRTCKTIGIPYTYKAIKAYLSAPAGYEARVSTLEAQGMTRSDAQAVIDAEDVSARS